MPIFEFKCLKCNDVFELLMMNRDESVKMFCPKCDSEDIERVVSCTNYNISGGSGGSMKSPGPSLQNRTCSGGNCSTFSIPGPD